MHTCRLRRRDGLYSRGGARSRRLWLRFIEQYRGHERGGDEAGRGRWRLLRFCLLLLRLLWALRLLRLLLRLRLRRVLLLLLELALLLLPRRGLVLWLLRLARLQHGRFERRILRNTLWLRSKWQLMRSWLLVRMSLLLMIVWMLLMHTRRSSAAVTVAGIRWLREGARRHLLHGALGLLRGRLVGRSLVGGCGCRRRIEAQQRAQGVFVRLCSSAHVGRGVSDSLAVRWRGLLCRLNGERGSDAKASSFSYTHTR